MLYYKSRQCPERDASIRLGSFRQIVIRGVTQKTGQSLRLLHHAHTWRHYHEPQKIVRLYEEQLQVHSDTSVLILKFLCSGFVIADCSAAEAVD